MATLAFVNAILANITNVNKNMVKLSQISEKKLLVEIDYTIGKSGDENITSYSDSEYYASYLFLKKYINDSPIEKLKKEKLVRTEFIMEQTSTHSEMHTFRSVKESTEYIDNFCTNSDFILNRYPSARQILTNINYMPYRSTCDNIEIKFLINDLNAHHNKNFYYMTFQIVKLNTFNEQDPSYKLYYDGKNQHSVKCIGYHLLWLNPNFSYEIPNETPEETKSKILDNFENLCIS